MPFSLPIFGSKAYGAISAAAGTVINRLVEPMRNAATVVATFEIQIGVTNQVLTVMRPLGSTTIAAAAAAGQAVINLTADPGSWSARRIVSNGIAGSDYVVYRCSDGTYVLDTVSSVATLAVTLSTNLPLDVVAGAPLWFFGVANDTNPSDSQSNPKFNIPGVAAAVSSGRFTLGDNPGETVAGIISTFGKYEPLIFQLNNATTTNTIEQVVAVYTNKLGPTTSNAAGTASA